VDRARREVDAKKNLSTSHQGIEEQFINPPHSRQRETDHLRVSGSNNGDGFGGHAQAVARRSWKAYMGLAN
jgi:hypothetical protein